MAKTKLLISGLPNIGKTTLLQSLTDVLVIARDGKVYPFPQPHVNVPDFETAEELIEIITNKINAYEEAYGKLPETIVIDSLSKILLDIEGNVLAKIKSFPYGVVNTEIKAVVDFIERDLAEEFNIVMVSHALYDEDVVGYKLVNAGGSWGKKGGILSEVDQAIFVELKGKNRIIHHKNPKLASRTTLKDLPETQTVTKDGEKPKKGDYNLQEHLDLICATQKDTAEWSL